MDLVLLRSIGVPKAFDELGFNPYFNGSSTSTPQLLKFIFKSIKSFNPYFNGSSTSTLGCFLTCKNGIKVSILILMDLVLLRIYYTAQRYNRVEFQSLF